MYSEDAGKKLSGLMLGSCKGAEIDILAHFIWTLGKPNLEKTIALVDKGGAKNYAKGRNPGVVHFFYVRTNPSVLQFFVEPMFRRVPAPR